jgi:hypothetical protein
MATAFPASMRLKWDINGEAANALEADGSRPGSVTDHDLAT